MQKNICHRLGFFAVATLLVFTSNAYAAVCKIDGNCNNANFKFRVVDAESGANMTGECTSDFAGSLRVFRALEETGQCSASLQAPECVIDGRCNNPDYTIRVIVKETGQNPIGMCATSVEEAVNYLQGLQETGQCSTNVQGQPCGIDARCGNANFKYRVFYTENNENPLGRCFGSFEDAAEAFRILRGVGQCTRSN